MKDERKNIEQLADQVADPIAEDDSLSRRAMRLRWLSEKIERGVATEEEVAEFRREFPRLVNDLNKSINPLVEAYASAAASVAEEIAKPMEEFAEAFSFSPSDQK